MSESGEETLVDVTYEMESIEGVTLDAANRKITVAESFDGNRIKLKATAGSDTVEFELKVVEDKNEITVRLHYHRPDGNYENWNIWTWDASSSAVVDFTSDDENGGKVAEIILPGRATSVMNYIIRKSVPGNEWAEKDVANDCYIDLSEVLSGTVDYYVESKEFPGKRVLGDDVLIGVKLLSVAYSSQKNTIKVVTGTPITRELDNIFILKRSDGTEIPITGVKLANKDKNEYEVSIGADLSGLEEISKNYSLFFDEYEYKVTMPSVYSSDKFETEYTYDGNDLGAVWSKEKTTFKVWAPTADKVQVNLYKSGTEGTDDLIETLEMTKGEKGVWAAEKEGDLNGTYYTYRVTVDGSTTEACDPYAKTTGVNGNRAMVINMDATNPAGWAEDRGPNAGMSYTDSVIYELHVRDFSIDASSGISDKNKGKFLGLTEKGTTNETGQTTGLDYLTDLGVTHIHLLPSYDYATVDETKLDEPQYNWGYDPKNYNVPEGSYSTDPYNGDVRVKEMKQMIKTLHDNNINVIMDVVYNHVYDADKFCFNQLVPKYFSRTNADGTYSIGSGCGNDTASERSMVKKYIVDSVNYWADEYHIDGFRFDLVGLLDTDTINEVVNTVHEKHPDAVFYGEGWTMNTAVSKDGYTMATQANSAETPQFAYFSDTIRNLLKGDTFSHESTGFVSGKTGQEELLSKCFTATTDWCKSPTQTVNYASCHDNYSLMDKLSVSRKDASFEERTKMNNLAAAIYMTAEGIPLIHAAEELLREKLDKNGEPVENSYNSSDLVNSIKWSNLDKEAYRNVRDYYKGLIAFRKNHAALRLTTAAEIKANVKYNWVSNELVMFVINGKDIAAEVSDGIVVIFNANTEAKDVDLYNYGVTEGTWNICINDQKAGIETLASVTDGKVTVAPISALVLVKGETKDNESVYDKIEQQKIEQLLKELNALIAQFEKEEQGNRTEETWTAFQTALQEARDAAGKTGVTAEELSLAKSNLQAAHDALKVPEGTVDKEMLKALAATYKEIFNAGQGSYTAESWNAFSEELAKAEALIENAEATQEEIDQAYSGLETAYKNLTSTKNTENLDALIAEYSKLEKGDYTDESWNAFQEALKAAKEIADKPNATQDEINKAEQDLRDAYTALKVPEGTIDKQKLNALIAVCDEIFNKGQGSYTAESWNAFTSALEEAKAVRDKADASQTEVDEARDRLDKAHHNLVSIEEEIKALKELIASCEKYTKDDYTTESWTVFEDALQAAKKAAENPNAALDEIQRAADDLQNAVNELIKVKQGLWTAWAPDSGLTAPENSEGKYHIAYAGKAFKPEIFVYDGKTKLKEKTDYTVSYKNNTNAGTATVTIKGKGNYAESITEEFIIDPIDLATLEIEDLYAAVASNNTKQAALKPVVKFNGKALKAGKDYTVAYKDPNGGKTPGNPSMEYDVTVDAVSVNFTGSKMIKMTLVDKDSAYLMSKASIGKIAKADMVYTGKVLQPQITVKYGKATLIKDTDYTVLYDDEHTEAGETATITIRGNGTTYFGEKTTSFKITGTPLKANQISLKDVPKTGLVYTGKAQTPEIDGIDKQNYEAVYQNNTNVGTAAVLITGKNGYTGTVKKTFKITAYDITASDKKFEYNINGSIPYAKGGSKLTDEQVGASFTINDGAVIKLQQGTDYTLSYKNNKKVGEGTVTIKGKGNYKGTIKNIPFTIAAQDLAVLEDTTTAADVLKKNAKKFNKVIPVITDFDGKTLKNKTDFEINAATAYTDKDGNVISSTEPEVGTAIKVTATGKGNYKGTVSATFYIIEDNMSIAKAAVQVDPQQYTGSEVTLRKDQIHVKLKINGALTELQEKDFEIVGYSKNIKKGTAKVTIRGLYPYGGTKTVNFKITACPLK
ncbi:MAG: type I pullulanase [Lachnospiraceae bacterium]|nr:type I pullulanase [Lachnospiraceae bacterium]